MAASPSGYLAGGVLVFSAAGPVWAGAWTSVDGLAWTRVLGDPVPPAGDVFEAIVALTWTGRTFVGVGHRFTGGDSRLVAWRVMPTP